MFHPVGCAGPTNGICIESTRRLSQSGVQAVAQGEIDDAILAAERDGGFGAMFGQRLESLAFAAGEDHREHILHGRDSIRTNPK